MNWSKVWNGLKASVTVILGLVLAFAGIQVARAIRSTLGHVEGSGHNFAVDPHDPGHLTVARPEGGTVTVSLPAGIRADQVRAVAYVPGGRATVELLP